MINCNQPFLFRYDPEVLDIFEKNSISLVISTYQIGKVIILSAENGKIVQLPRTFEGVMGISCDDETISIATKDEVIVCQNSTELAKTYPPSSNKYDAMYIPQAKYYTGELAMHDISYTKDGLIGINTRFSCLVKIDDKFNFTPIWKPYFINKFEPIDACHLNGMAVENDEILYATAFGKTSTSEGWRKNKYDSGLLIDVKKNKILLSDLSMPHSPRVYKNFIYLTESAKGELIKINRKTLKKEVLCSLPGFTRGIDIRGELLFLGMSKFREDHLYGDAPILKKYDSLKSGVAIFHLPTNTLIGVIEYINTVREIYDVKTLSHIRPNILNTNDSKFKLSLSTPEFTYWGEKNEF
ncbi:MAG: TIGR03032 family protein [Halarcobacter sp.]